MEYKRDANGFALPPTPAFTRSRSYRADAEDDLRVSSRKKSLIKDPYYRVANLTANNIYIRPFYEEFPEDIAGLIDHDIDLYDLEMGTVEGDVEKYFHTNIFLDPKLLDSLKRSNRLSMAKHIVLNVGSKLKSLSYPFFVIEVKADGPSGAGSFDKVQPIDSAAFSIAMNATEARLYISWKYNGLKYYTRKVDSFLFQKSNDYVEFRKYVRNIIDWGKDQRLKEIQDLLDGLLEENRKTASQLAKSRPPPSDDSASNSSQRRSK
ncbi:hypothetical protein BKA65DRAFT_559814 [Rhexocercosporidium sp. MPI-PUGE-AT-0058]|nr:hypothetical protein BKA65DRAFT_559814 [Rhexocercosporidium sp. MPI-PUGE-AT-0058]